MKAKDAFWNLLIFSQVRGMTSTGVAAVERFKNTVSILKDVGVPTDLCQYKQFDSIFSHGGKIAYIGHNRAKTIGEATKKNAHPFRHGDIVGAHNGTLLHSAKNKLEGRDQRFDTDSEGIFYNLDVNGIDDTTDKLHGAWALTWFNIANDRLYMTRNNQRDLYYCYSEDRKLIFWASEHWFLKAALLRNGFKAEDPYVVKEGHIHSWKIPAYGEPFQAPEIKPYREKVEEPKAPFVGTTSTHHSNVGVFSKAAKAVVSAINYKQGAACTPLSQSGKISYESLHSTNFAPDNLTYNGQGYCLIGKNQTRHYRGFDKNLIPKKYFEKLAVNGCSWCGTSPTWGDHVEFISRHEFICADCLATDDVKQYMGNNK